MVKRLGLAGLGLLVKRVAHRILSAEKLPRECLIDNRYFGRCKGIAVIEVTPRDQRRPKSPEVAGAYTIEE